MNVTARELLAAEIDSETLRALWGIAERNGLPLEALFEEALADLVKKRESVQPRSRVTDVYEDSIDLLGPLYKKLAE